MFGRRGVAELVEHMAQRTDVRVGGVQRRQTRRHALQRSPHFDHLDDLLLGLAHDEHAATRHRTQKTFLLEQRHRLADRRPAHAERLPELPLVEADLVAMGVDVRVHDRLLERGVGLIAKADVGTQRLQLQRQRSLGCLDKRCHGTPQLLTMSAAGSCAAAVRARCRINASTISTVGVGVPVRCPSSWITPTSASISIVLPRSRSCSMDILCAPSAPAPSRRRSASTRSRETEAFADRRRFPHHRAADRARTSIGRYVVDRGTCQRAHRVQTQVAPELEPDFVADVVADRGVQACGNEYIAQALEALRPVSVGCAEREFVAVFVTYDPWGDDLGGRIHHAADCSLDAQQPRLFAAGIDALERGMAEDVSRAVKIPVREAVARRDDVRIIAEQRQHGFNRAPDLMCLERDDDAVLRSQLRRSIGTGQMLNSLLAIDLQPQSPGCHRREVFPTRNQTHVDTGARKLGTEITANRPSAEYADLHVRSCSNPSSPEPPSIRQRFPLFVTCAGIRQPAWNGTMPAAAQQGGRLGPATPW